MGKDEKNLLTKLGGGGNLVYLGGAKWFKMVSSVFR